MFLRHTQEEIKQWADYNFGDVPSWQPLLGVVEEVGELAHAHLKRAQGIRGTAQEHRDAQRDAIGDIAIYLLDYCNREQLDFDQALIDTWKEVKLRDWKVYPKNGVSA